METSRELLHAQRRPGPRPRRHFARNDKSRLSARRRGRFPSVLILTLNEGRGRDPGDTSSALIHPNSDLVRAGAETPATV